MKKQRPFKKSASNPRILWVGGLVIVLFITELFIYTWCRVQCTRMGYEITQARNQYEKYNKAHYNLAIELARLKSPERISKKAKQELGLIVPGPKQIVVMP